MDLQQILILLGVLALGILIGHGIWSSRREKAQFEKSAQQFERQQIRTSQQAHHFQQQAQVYPPQAQQNGATTHADYPPQASSSQHYYAQQAQAAYTERAMSKNPTQTMTQEPPYQVNLPLEEEHAQAEQRVENIKITLPQTNHDNINEETAVQRQEYVQQQSAVEMRAHAQQIQEEQSEPAVVAQESQSEEKVAETQSVTAENAGAQKKPEFIMLYVVAPENRQFYGTHINEVLEDLGFIFGEYNIYHRHLDVNMVKSPVIFSVANMVQPGTFDPNNFDNFATIGLTLFMRLPSPGNDIVNFRMLCCAAETLAEKLNGFILNDKREIFTDEQRDEYLQLLRS